MPVAAPCRFVPKPARSGRPRARPAPGPPPGTGAFLGAGGLRTPPQLGRFDLASEYETFGCRRVVLPRRRPSPSL